MLRFIATKTVVAGFGAGMMLCLAGCGPRSQDDRIKGRMFYRGVPKPAPQSNSISVGRQGKYAEYGTWGDRGAANSSEWGDAPMAIGRAGTTAEYSTWSATSTGGEPQGRGMESSSYGSTGGSSLGVNGNTASSSEGTEGSARYGHTP